jgi:hypothetical protein
VTFKRKKISPILNEGLGKWLFLYDSQKHEKYALQAHDNIGLGGIGTFSYWIIRYKYKEIYIKKWFGVLI